VASKVYDYDLGEPDDLFADMHNFAVNAVIRLNLMILDHGGEKNYIYMFVSLEGPSPYDLIRT
jgi:hypothetical protein